MLQNGTVRNQPPSHQRKNNLMNRNDFVNLHCHTTFSIFDGLGFPIDHMRSVLESGQSALAITDHGTMAALSHQVDAYNVLKKEGKKIKPIYGVEAYYINSLSRWHKEYETWKFEHHKSHDEEENNVILEDDVSLKTGSNKSILNRRSHLLLLAKNPVGLKNLFKLISFSYKRENFYRFPRIDREIIKQHKEGLVVSSACLGGLFGNIYQTKKFEGQDVVLDSLRKEINWWLEVFGDDFYGELQWNSSPDQHILNQYVIQLSYEYGFKLITTCDAHYPKREQWKDREIYKRLGWISKSSTEKPAWMSEELPSSIAQTGYELYPKNGDEVWDSFLHFSSLANVSYDHNLIENSLRETANIAFGKIEDFFPDTKVKLPSWVVPEGKRPEQVLARFCANEMKNRSFGTDPVYIERLKNELYVIKDRGFSKYFLTMKMIVDEARERFLVGCGRGSGAGSLVSYLLGITQVDPIKWGLQFERFLSRNGTNFPDLDVDFSDPVALKEFFKEKWGENSVVQITNFNTLQVRSLIKDISKFNDIHWEEVNDVIIAMVKETMAIAKKEHDVAAGVYVPTYEEYKKHSSTLQAFLQKYPQVDTHIEVLHGQVKSLGSHASGTLIADNLDEQMPLISVGGKIQTPWTEGQAQRHLEPFGFIKFDLLGLATLKMFETCIGQVLRRRFNNPNPTFADIKKFYEEKMHPDVIDLDDQNVWEGVFHAGKWLGIFQFANRGAQQFCQQVKPRSIRELSDVTAIYRPGPLSANVHDKYLSIKSGEEYPEYVNPIVEGVLGLTQGQLIYQEQIATLAHRLGDGLSLDDGNVLRKLLTKKGTGKNDLLEGLYAKFREGCIDKGISPEKTDELLQHIEFFNKYGFNLCLSGGVEVTTSLGKRKKISDVKEGELVETTKGFKKVRRVFRQGKKEVFLVKTKSGKTIVSTMEHKYETRFGVLPLKEIVEKKYKIIVKKT